MDMGVLGSFAYDEMVGSNSEKTIKATNGMHLFTFNAISKKLVLKVIYNTID